MQTQGSMDSATSRQMEERLVQRCLEGDDRAWEHIIREYSRRIYNLAYQYTRNTGQAEDLTQEIFLRVYQSLASFRPASGTLLNWLMRVSRNLIIDHYRQSRRRQVSGGSDLLEKLDFGDDRQPDALNSLERQQEHSLLWNCLATLSPELREAVILRDLQELTYDEIGNILKVPEGTVKSRINRGRIELAKVLRKRKVRLEG
jgi:RNA polymerase sigma-70 factor (ECF subfamily)